MASTLYFRNIASGIGTALRFAFPGRGASVVTNTVTLVAGPSTIDWTITAGGTIAEWVSPRVPSGGFTLSGSVTVNGWFRELATNDNCGVQVRLYKRAPGGGETELTGSPWPFGGGTPTEFTTTLAAKNWSFTPTSMAFSEDDRLVVRFQAIDANGTMTAGSAEFTTNGGTAAASGDSYITLTETVDWKTETITKTVKTSGGDYSLLSSWESANQSDLVTDDVIAQAECYAGAYTDTLNLAGWTTGASNYIRVYTPTAERHNGTARDVSGSGFQIANTGVVLTVAEDYCRFEGLDVKSTSTNSCLQATVLTASANDIRIDSCIFQATGVGTTTSIVALTADVDFIGYIRNSIIYGTGIGIQAQGGTGAIEISHCTVQATGLYGIRYAGGATVKNNWAGGASTECFRLEAGSPTGNNNASTDASADDEFPTGALINQTAADQFVSLTGGSEDFHLKSGSSLLGAGADLSVDVDIVGNARGATPDIGAFEATFITGTLASNLNAVTSAFTGIEEFTGTVAANLNAVTAALSGEVEASAPTGTIASTLNAVTAALTGEETFTGTIAGSLNPVTAELTGTETITGTVAGSLNPVTTALAGDVVSPVEGTLAGTLAAVAALLEGDAGGELDSWGPVYARGTYKRLAKRRRKKREDLEALAHELRVLLGLGPDLPPGEPVPAGAVAPVTLGVTAAPFLVGIEQDPLRVQVQRMLAAVQELEARHAAALDDDDDAILALMEAA